jgi:hypothetical protein
MAGRSFEELIKNSWRRIPDILLAIDARSVDTKKAHFAAGAAEQACFD